MNTEGLTQRKKKGDASGSIVNEATNNQEEEKTHKTIVGSGQNKLNMLEEVFLLGLKDNEVKKIMLIIKGLFVFLE